MNIIAFRDRTAEGSEQPFIRWVLGIWIFDCGFWIWWKERLSQYNELSVGGLSGLPFDGYRFHCEP